MEVSEESNHLEAPTTAIDNSWITNNSSEHRTSYLLYFYRLNDAKTKLFQFGNPKFFIQWASSPILTATIQINNSKIVDY